MVSQYETILATFAECPLPPLYHVLNHAYLTYLNSHLNLCTASVHRKLGTRTVGYLVLTAHPASFEMACSDIFSQPKNPGATFEFSETLPSAAVIGTLTRKHIEYLCVFNEYHNVDKASKNSFFHWFPMPTTGRSRKITPDIQQCRVSPYWLTYGPPTENSKTMRYRKTTNKLKWPSPMIKPL